MIAKLSASSLSIWADNELIQWVPVDDNTDLVEALGHMGYSMQQDWTTQDNYLVTVIS